MPLRDALRLPLNQGLALKAALIATDPMVDADISGGYIAQEVKRRVAEKMKQLENEI